MVRKNVENKRKPKQGGMFGGFDKAKRPGGKLPFIIPGSYVLKVEGLKAVEGVNSDYFVAEFRTVRSDRPERPKGKMQAWIVDLAKPSGPGNVRDFIGHLAGIDFDEVTEAMASGAVSAKQPLSNVYVECEATEIETRRGTPFTVCAWSLIGSKADYLKRKSNKPVASRVAKAPRDPDAPRRGKKKPRRR